MDGEQKDGRISINVRVDSAKYALIEKKRVTGWGPAQTERNRSDVINELLGNGILVDDMRGRLGDRDFGKLWYIINNLDLKRLNLEGIERFVKK